MKGREEITKQDFFAFDNLVHKKSEKERKRNAKRNARSFRVPRDFWDCFPVAFLFRKSGTRSCCVPRFQERVPIGTRSLMPCIIH